MIMGEAEVRIEGHAQHARPTAYMHGGTATAILSERQQKQGPYQAA